MHIRNANSIHGTKVRCRIQGQLFITVIQSVCRVCRVHRFRVFSIIARQINSGCLITTSSPIYTSRENRIGNDIFQFFVNKLFASLKFSDFKMRTFARMVLAIVACTLISFECVNGDSPRVLSPDGTYAHGI